LLPVTGALVPLAVVVLLAAVLPPSGAVLLAATGVPGLTTLAPMATGCADRSCPTD